eukprot:s1099_g12.t1
MNACVIETEDSFAVVSPVQFVRLLNLQSMSWPMEVDGNNSWTWNLRLPDCHTVQVTMTRGFKVLDLFTACGVPIHLHNDWYIIDPHTKEILGSQAQLPLTNMQLVLAFAFRLFDQPRDSRLTEVSPTAPWTQVPTDASEHDTHAETNMTQDAACLPMHVNSVSQSGPKRRCVEVDSRACLPDAKPRVLELVALAGTTTFIPVANGKTIRSALKNAGYSDDFLQHIKPFCNGREVSMDEVLQTLPDVPIRLRAFPLKGGAKPDATTKAKTKQDEDLVFLNDPWAKDKTTANQQCKWDQLILAKSHPFHDEKGNRLSQVSKLQLGSQCGGIAMCTKTFLATALTLTPPTTTVLLLPAMKELITVDASLSHKVLPVQEVIVEEPETKKSYKRKVLPFVVTGSTQFKIAEESSVEITAEKFAELVFELHPKLCNSTLRTLLQETPLQAFKQAINMNSLPQTELSLYAHRIVNHKDAEKVHQTLAKLPDKHRKEFLLSSGAHGFFCREFVPRETVQLDHAVLPRYWNVEMDSIKQCKELGKTIEGFRGIALTFKGLAIRVDNVHIGDGRSAVLQSDSRFNDTNRQTIVNETWVAMGFSFNMSHAGIIEAVNKAIGMPCVPLRSFKSNGMICWILGFEATPKKTAFTVKIDACAHEILLAKEETNRAKTRVSLKATKTTKHHSIATPKQIEKTEFSIAASSSADTKRIEVLENKMAAMEHRQISLESKVDQRFDDVANQLNMILHAVTPNMQVRQRESTNSGSPPSKVQKNA